MFVNFALIRTIKESLVTGVLGIFDGPSNAHHTYFYQPNADREPNYDGPLYCVTADVCTTKERLPHCFRGIFDKTVFFKNFREELASKSLIEIRMGDEIVYIYQHGIEIEIKDAYGVRHWIINFATKEITYQGSLEAITLGCSFFNFEPEKFREVKILMVEEGKSSVLSVGSHSFEPGEIITCSNDGHEEQEKLCIKQFELRGKEPVSKGFTAFAALKSLIVQTSSGAQR